MTLAGFRSRWTMPVVVGLGHRPGDRADQGDGLRDRRRAAAVQSSRQRLALDVGHGQVGPAVDLADVVHRADVGVVQDGGRPRLGQEPLPPDERIVFKQAGNLESDEAIQLRVVRQVDRPHPAAPEQTPQLVSAERPGELFGLRWSEV